jgi:hypothetical protein
MISGLWNTSACVLQCVHASYSEGVRAPLLIPQVCGSADHLEVADELCPRDLPLGAFTLLSQQGGDAMKTAIDWVRIHEVHNVLHCSIKVLSLELAREDELVPDSLNRI